MYAAYKHGKASRIDDEFLWRKDGTGLPVEYGATPILKDGVVIGSVVSFTDITVRKEAEERMNAYFNSSSDGLLILSPERGFIDANQCRCEPVRFRQGSRPAQVRPGRAFPGTPARWPSSRAKRPSSTIKNGACRSSTPLRFDWITSAGTAREFPCEVTLIRITLEGSSPSCSPASATSPSASGQEAIARATSRRPRRPRR